MNFDKYNILSILDYPITDELFKEKIGSGDDLKELVKERILREDWDGRYLVNFESSKIKKYSVDVDKESIHKKIIQDYYLYNLKEDITLDYRVFSERYQDYINLSYHYRAIGEYDCAIENIFKISKKLVYWGYGDKLLEEFDKYKLEQLKVMDNNLWKQFYIFFCQLINPSLTIKEFEFFEFIKIIEKDPIGNQNLYLEMKNLEGLYYENIKKDTSKAINIFKEVITFIEDNKLNENCNADNYQQIKMSYARVLENSAIYGSDINLVRDNEPLYKAEEIFKKYNDEYELCKLYFFKAKAKAKDCEINDFIQECKKIKKVLNKYAFPDIERNYFNLLANFMLEDYDTDFTGYIEMKVEALTTDLLLYPKDFLFDIFDILRNIEGLWRNEGYKIAEDLDPLIEFLNKMEIEDELYFIKGIKLFLEKEREDTEFEKIKDKPLKDFAYKYIEALKEAT